MIQCAYQCGIMILILNVQNTGSTVLSVED